MPALDNAAASNAKSLLNGIDYAAVIGGPLQAAITAQAMAARSTWEFIQQVGLTTDENGNKQAVNVSFTYMRDGEMVKLIVPILTIVPIPAIEITDIDIGFKVSINASASQSSEETSSTQLGGEVGGSAKVGWGAFSGEANFKANYSSKKDSKATQDSKYSVEYTQDIHVKAGQAGVPAGLATILNILSSSATGASLDGRLDVAPAIGEINAGAPDKQQNVQLKLVDANGLNVKAGKVTITVPDGVKDKLVLSKAPLGEEIDVTGAPVEVDTGTDGTCALMLGIKTGAVDLPRVLELKFATKVGGKDLSGSLPVRVVPPLNP